LGYETVIQDSDRSGWFGASDTSYIMGRWGTKTFRTWWLTKLGLNTSNFTTRAMNAGTYYERAVLDAVGAPRRDHQILIPEYSLRINLDGDGPERVDEVKTHKAEKPFKATKAYWQQVQVQCYGKLREEGTVPRATIHAYGLTEEDYKNFFNPIDLDRLTHHPIEYDPDFIVGYLGRVEYLHGCLRKGVFPDENCI
jgi:hypothetical protein